jgi:hypothetical protein
MELVGFELVESEAMGCLSNIYVKQLIDRKVEYVWCVCGSFTSAADAQVFQKDLELFLNGISVYLVRFGCHGATVTAGDLHLSGGYNFQEEARTSLYHFLMVTSMGVTASDLEGSDRPQLASFTKEVFGWSMLTWSSRASDTGLGVYPSKIDNRDDLQNSDLLAIARAVSTGETLHFDGRWYRPIVVPSLEKGEMLSVLGMRDVWPIAEVDNDYVCVIQEILYESDRCLIKLLKRGDLQEIRVSGEEFHYFQRVIASGKYFVGMGREFVFGLNLKNISQFITRSVLEAERAVAESRELLSQLNNQVKDSKIKKEEINRLDTELNSKAEEVSSRIEELNRLDKEVRSRQEEINSLGSDIKLRAEESDNKEKQLGSLNKQIQTLTDQLKLVTDEIETKEEEISRLNKEVNSRLEELNIWSFD